MEKIKGVNLGNWLVLEKWMSPALFDGTTAEDEYYLPTQLSRDAYEARIKIHRSEYISERDFATIARIGLNTVRIPIPYFIYGDRAPFIGCIEELDKAFKWAEKYGLRILIDLHTVPMSQNGFDNGGISGVCKWSQIPEEVDYVVNLLGKLAERYGKREGLWGIQPLNEPITEPMWSAMDVQGRYPPVDKELAAGSVPNTMEFLRGFYDRAYDAIKPHLGEGKKVVFHDAFRLKDWKDYLTQEKYIGNVVLDTHQYLMIAEAFGCRVIFYSVTGNSTVTDYERVDFDTVLRESDYLSIHCPLSDLTRDLIDAAAFSRMKKTAYIINVARGPIINEDALYDALMNDKIAGAGLDVLSKEPMAKDSKLQSIQDSGRLIVTPHLAWASVEARERCVSINYDNIKAFLEGRELNRVDLA